MATTPLFSHSLFTLPFSYATDFTELADNCERFVEGLVECHDPVEKLAICARLSACLALLQPTLTEPVPQHLQASLTVETFPTRFPLFEPEPDQMGRYCQLLTHLLMSKTLSDDMERVAGDLLQDLVGYFADTLKAPRWLKTEDGVRVL